MQVPIVCPSCAAVIPTSVPELTRGVWHTNCPACGRLTELKAKLGEPEELASFSASGSPVAQPPPAEPKS